MLTALPAPLRGAFASLALVLNTLVCAAALFPLALLRLVLPARSVRRRLDPWLNAIATGWIAGNGLWMRATQRTAWDVQGDEALPARGWTMVTCNHQSWADIFVLQRVLNRRIPLLKFFLKRELLYVPVIGLAWWALDFPFMRRHSDAALRRDPAKRLQDIEATRRACAKFALVPTSVMNFVEGTRFTAEKRAAQGTPWVHLLAPKAGGMAAALEALGERFDSLLDVTIVYPDGVPGFGDFLCGRVPRVVVRMQQRAIPPECRAPGPAQRRHVQRWLRELWHEKDRLIGTLLQPPAPRADVSPAAADETSARPAVRSTVGASG